MTHILVVEDEDHLAKGIQFNLQAEGYQVTTVDHGAAALERVRDGKNPIDLIILDLMLPGMSGYAVCEQLRALGAEMPVLILSARTLSEDRTRGFDAGADQYLTKPFELDELLSRVNGLLVRHRRRTAQRLARPEPPAVYELGNAIRPLQDVRSDLPGKGPKDDAARDAAAGLPGAQRRPNREPAGVAGTGLGPCSASPPRSSWSRS